VTKDPASADSGCIFVLNRGATLVIDDAVSDTRGYTNNPPAAGELGTPAMDKFEAAIVASAGSTFQTVKGLKGATTKSTDRLEIHGWVYSADAVPLFKRDLAPVDNRRFPAEYLVYDAKLLDLFRPILGSVKTVDLTCGTSDHVLCVTTN
jgi:hypothetical protein